MFYGSEEFFLHSSSTELCACLCIFCPLIQLQASILTYCVGQRPTLDDNTHSAS
jgi:hypothetical protein